jgi:hypothetical protein
VQRWSAQLRILSCSTLQSIWTVDLAHLLRRYGCSVFFSTLTVGANPAFSSEYFYKGQIATDRSRVERLFREAQEAGIGVRIGSMTWQELRDYLRRGNCLAIVLVDKWKLREGARCCCGLVPGYAGHYIVVSAFREDSSQFVVQDPACSAPQKLMRAASLDQARQSFGTDEDVLIVSRVRPAESHDSENSCAGASAQEELWHYS